MKDKHAFVDTNILYYAYDKKAGEKHEKGKKLVEELWSRELLPAISIQVLQELYVTLLKRGAPSDKAREIVSDYFSWNIIDNNLPVFTDALRLHRRYQISFWDGLIVAAALAANAGILYSEDLNHGQKYDNILAVNPFAA